MNRLSFVIPAKNEQNSIGAVVEELVVAYPQAEVIVVDDGSIDKTAELAEAAGVRVLRHPYSKGNGAAVKTGIRAVSGDVVVMMDADGQHRVSDVAGLLDGIEAGFDMVVGTRDGAGQASWSRALANKLYNGLASYITGHPILDLTSGMRAIRIDKISRFLYLLPNGFSYPTTSTMAFFRSGYSVKYHPIDVKKRAGLSHINPLKDGVRFLLIIFKVGTLCSPLKVFFPVSLVLFLSAISYYMLTYFSDGRLTNMTVILFVTSLITFFMGLMSEQLTSLQYKDT